MRERNPPIWLYVAAVVLSGLAIYNADMPEPKIYKNGYEVVKIGNCDYLKDYGMFHETLVHDGECKNHGDTVYMYLKSVAIQADSITQQVTAKVKYK